MKVYMLTTIDNPWNPLDDSEFSSWLSWDQAHNYNCNEILARIAKVSDSLSDYEYNEQISEAIDDFLNIDFQNIYKKVSQEVA